MSANQIELVDELSELMAFPCNVISPFSSLGFDIPFFANKKTEREIRVYHGFGQEYDDWVKQKYPSWSPMFCETASNYQGVEIGVFLEDVNR